MGFARAVQTFAVKAKLRPEIVVRKIALDVYTGVILRSPVDTGRFRANWRVGVNRRNLTVSEKGDAGASSGAQFGSPPSGQEIGPRIVALNRVKFGDTVFITNNLPYAQPLEDGHSQQNPNGILRRTADEVRRNLLSVIAQVRGGLIV